MCGFPQWRGLIRGQGFHKHAVRLAVRCPRWSKKPRHLRRRFVKLGGGNKKILNLVEALDGLQRGLTNKFPISPQDRVAF
jgi:hypothetical protein